MRFSTTCGDLPNESNIGELGLNACVRTNHGQMCRLLINTRLFSVSCSAKTRQDCLLIMIRHTMHFTRDVFSLAHTCISLLFSVIHGSRIFLCSAL